jgi:hypothetical protein
VLGCWGPVERFEKPLTNLLRYGVALVGHPNLQSLLITPRKHSYWRLWGSIGKGILEDVRNELRNALWVARYTAAQIEAGLNGSIRFGSAISGDYVVDQDFQIDVREAIDRQAIESAPSSEVHYVINEPLHLSVFLG